LLFKGNLVVNYYREKINSFFGMLAGLVLSLFGKRRIKPTTRDFERADFTASTQRLGVRFSEKIRNCFRFKWLKKI